jgi:hypothetical protein
MVNEGKDRFSWAILPVVTAIVSVLGLLPVLQALECADDIIAIRVCKEGP